MRTLAAVAIVLGMIPAAAAAQGGKIDGVERAAADARGSGSADCDCDFDSDASSSDGSSSSGSALRKPGQGYLDYPYRGGHYSGTPFVVRRADEGRRFQSVSVSHYADPASTLTGTHLEIEAVGGIAWLGAEWGLHVEPLADETDVLHTLRFGLGVVPRLGDIGFLKTNVAFRMIVLDDGEAAEGLDLELGAQLFPARPFGVMGSVRAAAMSWDENNSFGMYESRAAASVFLGRIEVEGGWRWTKIGRTAAFSGPTLGVRVWF